MKLTISALLRSNVKIQSYYFCFSLIRVKHLFRYDEQSNLWSEVTGMNQPRCTASVAPCTFGAIATSFIVFGGFDGKPLA